MNNHESGVHRCSVQGSDVGRGDGEGLVHIGKTMAEYDELATGTANRQLIHTSFV